MRVLLGSMLIVACGGASPAAEETPACESERAAVETATATRDGCVGSGGEVDEDEAAYQALHTALVEHEAGLAAAPSVTDAEAMALGDAYWAYLDRVASHFTDHGPLDRAEDAAEALVRDREGDGAREAARSAREQLEAIHAETSPDGARAEPCAEEVEILHEAEATLARCTESAGS